MGHLEHYRGESGQFRSVQVMACGNDGSQAPASVGHGVLVAAGQATVEVLHNLVDIAQELGVMGGAGHGAAKRRG